MNKTHTPVHPDFCVQLEYWEYIHASNVGIGRFTANWGKQDAPHYNNNLKEDDRTASVASAICELAVAKSQNRYWHAHVWTPEDHKKYRSMPDVGANIEVRRVRTGNSVPVRKRELGRGIVIFGAYAIPPEFRSVEIWGWIEADRAWELGEPAHYDEAGNTRLVHKSLLEAPEFKL